MERTTIEQPYTVVTCIVSMGHPVNNSHFCSDNVVCTGVANNGNKIWHVLICVVNLQQQQFFKFYFVESAGIPEGNSVVHHCLLNYTIQTNSYQGKKIKPINTNIILLFGNLYSDWYI